MACSRLPSALVLVPLAFAGCGGDDPGSGAQDSAVHRFLAEAEAFDEEGSAAPADFTQPRVAGWTLLEPACEFPLRLQVPPGWDLDEDETRSISVTLRRDGENVVDVRISSTGGSTAIQDQAEGLEQHDPSVTRLGEVTYGPRTMPVLGGPDGQSVIAYPPVEHVSDVSGWHAVVRLSAIWDDDGNPQVDEATLASLAATLEPNDC